MAVQGLVKFDTDKDIRNYIRIESMQMHRVEYAQGEVQKEYQAVFAYGEYLMNGDSLVKHKQGGVEVIVDIESDVKLIEQGYAAIKAKPEFADYIDA